MRGKRRAELRGIHFMTGLTGWFLMFLMAVFIPSQARGQSPDVTLQSVIQRIREGRGILNHGSRRLSPEAIAISIDLCPSTKLWNLPLFERLVALGKMLHTPLPIAVAVSGRWMQRYPKALKQMIQWNKEGELSISWVNHSDTHPVRGGFLVNPRVDFTGEVENQAACMRRNGIFNTPFFRFPGLVFNSVRLKQLGGMGFVALGADAWLAKGQRVRNGSIILVHGNGNEKRGVRLLFRYITRKEKAILAGQLRVVSLEDLLIESVKIEPDLHFISWSHPVSK